METPPGLEKLYVHSNLFLKVGSTYVFKKNNLFDRINLIYGTVCEQCTDTSCPTMSGGPKYEYLWQDGIKYKKPTHLPANQVSTIR